MRDIAAETAAIEEAIAGRTLCDLFADRVRANPDLVALRARRGETWDELTWSQYREAVRDVALGLSVSGFQPGEFAAITCRNRPEHVIADLGVVHGRGTPVSLYNTLAPEQVSFIAGHCEATVAFVEDAAFLETYLGVRDSLPRLRLIVLMEGDVPAGAEDVITWDELLARGRRAHDRDGEAFERLWRQVRPEHLATLIYTSGTTGPPKAVMITNGNVLFEMESIIRSVDVGIGARVISYLPLAHVAERVASHWQAIARGMSTSFCPDATQIGACLVAVKPQWFVGVPRVWEKLYAGINAALAAEPDENRRRMIDGAISLGRERVRLEQAQQPVPPQMAQRLEQAAPVFHAILTKVGMDECATAITGAAPISVEVLTFFHALGLPICEVWGMSELTGAASWNLPGNVRIGSVGPAMPGVDLRIDENGELLCRSGLVMAGYYKDPEQTAETIDDSGWLHTGDVATVDEDGFFFIVDRMKELIITAGGKNLSPANIENLLKQHPLVGQAAVIGDRRPYLAALLVLDPEVAPVWAAKRGISDTSTASLARDPQVLDEIIGAVAAANRHLSRVEQIKRVALLPVEWTAQSEELTPTLKLKRRVVNSRYGEVIEGLYAGTEGHDVAAAAERETAPA
jgi:long-chain acyl-CoA synthetase